MSNGSRVRKPYEVTGRTVLVTFIAFFGVVFTVNAIMVRAATSTFGGVETQSSYKAGLAFRQETESARAQDARRWDVQTSLVRKSAEDVMLEATIRDAVGAVPVGLSATARLAHPADARRDRTIVLRQEGNGRFRGQSEATAGQWDLIIDFTKDGERAFRSKSRVILR